MSLVNVHLEPHIARVLIDTAGQDAAGRVQGSYAISKAVTLPHMPALLAVRGLNATLTTAYARASHTVPCTFEAIAEIVPGAIREALRLVRRHSPKADIRSQEITLCGWSSERQRMRCMCFKSSSSRKWLRAVDEIEVHELDGEEEDAMLSPWAEDWGPMLNVPDESGMLLASRIQIQKARQLEPGAAIGGRLILFELSKDQLMQRVVYREEDRA